MPCSTSRRKPSSDADKRDLRDLAHRQDVLKERTEELHEKLESLFQLFPQLDPKIVQGIGEAGNSMGNAKIASASSIRAAPCRPSAAALERSVAIAAADAIRRCSKWRSAGNSAICR